jgi:hypothetical protein
MKTTSPTVCAPRMWLFRPLAVKFRGVLLLLLLFGMASSATAAITFDNSSSSAVAQRVRSIAWRHTIGAGSDRALVVTVSTDDFKIFSGDVATVTFNNVAMRSAPNSHAVSLGLRILETQIF